MAESCDDVMSCDDVLYCIITFLQDISSDSDDQLEQGSGDISMESTDNET